MSTTLRRIAVSRWVMAAFGLTGLLLAVSPITDRALWPIAAVSGWIIGAFHMWGAMSAGPQVEASQDAIPPPGTAPQ